MLDGEQFFTTGIDADAIEYIILRNFSITYSELKAMKMSKVLKFIKWLREEYKEVKWDV